MSTARGSSREFCDDLKVIRNYSVFLSEKKPRSLDGKRGFFHGWAGKGKGTKFRYLFRNQPRHPAGSSVRLGFVRQGLGVEIGFLLGSSQTP